jgi:hypothetical protein
MREVHALVRTLAQEPLDAITAAGEHLRLRRCPDRQRELPGKSGATPIAEPLTTRAKPPAPITANSGGKTIPTLTAEGRIRPILMPTLRAPHH